MKSTIKKSVAVLLALLLTLSTVMLSTMTALAASDNALKVTATSNAFPSETTEITNFVPYQDTDGEAYVAVEYKLLAADKYLINFQGVLTWDNTMLEFKEAYNTITVGTREQLNVFPFAVSQGCGVGTVNTFQDGNTGRIACNYSSVVPAAYANEEDGTAVTVVKAVFRVLNRNAETTVDCAVNTISLCDESVEKPYTQYFLVNNNVPDEDPASIATCTTVIESAVDNPVHEHTYSFVDGSFVCSACGEVLDTTGYNGTHTIGDDLYFFIAGNSISGWQTEDTNSYYFDPATFAAVDGAQTIDGLDYVFTDKVLTKGAWRVTEEGRAYYWAGAPKQAEWAVIEGETYYFNAAGIAATGYYPLAQDGNDTLYHFTDEGALIETIEQENGIFFTPEDAKEIYYFKDGYLFDAGLVEYNYEYYYFPSSFKAMRNAGITIDDQSAHGYVPAGYYEFDDDCHIIYDFKNGVQEDGTVYKNGIKLKAYTLVQFDGNWYLVAENNKIAKGQRRYLNAAVVEGTGFAVGYYEFDENGVLMDLNGPDENDYFYIHNEKQKAYKLCVYDGNWYLVAEYNKIARDQRRYLNASMVEGTDFTVGYYYFDAEGHLTSINGPQSDGYFYINNEKQTAYKLCAYEGNYYFVAEYNKYAVNQTRYLSADNLEGTGYSAGYYYFDTDGKMQTKNGPWTDGYFYDHNVKVNAYKLVAFEGNWYYICEYNKYAVNATRNLSADVVAGTPFTAGQYQFGEDGAMIFRQGPNADGYFYQNNEKVKAYKLCEYNGDYYLIAENNKIVKNATRNVQAAWVGDTGIAPGQYSFDAEGKMVH